MGQSARVLVVAAIALAVVLSARLIDGLPFLPPQTTDQLAVGVPTTARAAHDVAVLSVDFDPPLAAASLAGRVPSLLVAVDNRGAEGESGVRIDLRMVGDDQTEVARSRTELIGSLSPGEVKVVRLPEAAGFPLRQDAWIVVRVDVPHGDTDFSNNYRTIRIDRPGIKTSD